MKGDIALAGFMMTAAEWDALDAPSRALLLAIDAGEAVDPAQLALPLEPPAFLASGTIPPPFAAAPIAIDPPSGPLARGSAPIELSPFDDAS